ncbi:helix-turn-helix transcriptional regulator [Eubacteriales bacterium OttesenSCG-928-A19]|nr:helix-turn-helix transcriptional regulator [Eubacteriales bacterium OttesenSCG-928-A19]
MLRLRVLELLEEQGKTKYSLFKVMGMSYQNYNRMITNQTKSIRKEAMETMCIFFDCTPNDLFEYDFSLSDTRNDAKQGK